MSGSLGYLLDTNVVSELRLGRPNAGVDAFAVAAPRKKLFVSVMTLAELRKGWALKRRSDAIGAPRLSAWIDAVHLQLADRILAIDLAAANIFGELSASRTRPVVDTLLAATALAHNLTLVTRNTRDVEDTGVTLLNPWL